MKCIENFIRKVLLTTFSANLSVISSVTLSVLTPSHARAGGHLVGNAHTVEQNIVFSYVALPKAIQQCLSLRNDCPLDDRDTKIINRIRQIVIDHPFSTSRIEFASKITNPGAFHSDLQSEHGIAQTEISNPDAIIRWNQDLFYNTDGTSAIDLPFITAIWIHELGHQAGEINHEYLDGLGAKVRTLLKSQIHEDLYPAQSFLGTPVHLSVTYINFFGSSATTDLYVSDGENTVSMSHFLTDSVHCSDPNALRTGWTINSASYTSRPLYQENQASVSYKGWLTVRCLKDKQLTEEDQDLNLVIQLSKTSEQYLYDKVILTSKPMTNQ